MTIYFPDDLGERIKAAEGLNVSGVCQAAVEQELDLREHLAQLGENMERVVAQTENRGHVAFTGRFIGAKFGEVTVYLTRREQLAVLYDDRSGAGQLDVYETFDDFENAWGAEPWVQEIGAELGYDRPIELDI